MTATTDRAESLADFARHAFRIGADFTVDVKTAGEFRAVITTIGGHNELDPHATADAIASADLIGSMSRVQVEHFTAGPALYFALPFWTHQRIDARDRAFTGAVKYTADERKAMAAQVREIGRSLAADEITVRQFPNGSDVETDWHGTGENPVEVRLWWD